MYLLHVIILFILLYCSVLNAQQQATISGHIYYEESGETVLGANIYLQDNSEVGTISNAYGFYSLTLDTGSYTIIYSYLGVETAYRTIDLKRDTLINVFLKEGVALEEVVVTEAEKEQITETAEMSKINLSMEQVKTLPVVMGEVDIMKTLQLLPGVATASEGSSGLNIRGGNIDQNLVLLDDAVVYNTGHLLGFFSVFNPDAIKDLTLYKGSIPAEFGGRLSSVVDVHMKDGNNRQYEVNGGIGLIASRLTVEGPLVKGKSSFILSGRRTYLFDLAKLIFNSEELEGTNYYFYDFNAKVNYTLNERDRIFISGYFGRDVFRFRNAEAGFDLSTPYGNNTLTLRWNHIFSNKLFSNTSFIFNKYTFEFTGKQDEFSARLSSGVRDLTFKYDLEYYPSPTHNVKGGIYYTYHKLTPSMVTATTGEADFATDFIPKKSHQVAVYVQDEFEVNSRLSINAGIRLSSFHHIGPYTSPLDATKKFDKGEIVESFWGIEPRLGIRYEFLPGKAVKGGATWNTQYIHLVSNSTSTLPTDVWVPSSELVKPQRGYELVLGYFQSWYNNKYEFSVEGYYRKMNDMLDYRDSYVPNLATEVELQYVSGEGEAYGTEFMLRKNKGRFTGWLSYTLSRSVRSFEEIEDGRTYPAIFDRIHDGSVVGSWKLNKKIILSGTFVYATGRAFTPYAGLQFLDGELTPVYGPRNSARLPDYHRMDLAVTWIPSGGNKNFESRWVFSVYNIYNRKNVTFFYTDFDVNEEQLTFSATAYKVSIFPLIPSITWNFRWKR